MQQVPRHHRCVPPTPEAPPGCQVSPESRKMGTSRAAQPAGNTRPFVFQAGRCGSWSPVLTRPCAHGTPALLRMEHNLLKSTCSSQPRARSAQTPCALRSSAHTRRLPRAGGSDTTECNFLHVCYFHLTRPRPSSFIMLSRLC